MECAGRRLWQLSSTALWSSLASSRKKSSCASTAVQPRQCQNAEAWGRPDTSKPDFFGFRTKSSRNSWWWRKSMGRWMTQTSPPKSTRKPCWKITWREWDMRRLGGRGTRNLCSPWPNSATYRSVFFFKVCIPPSEPAGLHAQGVQTCNNLLWAAI